MAAVTAALTPEHVDCGHQDATQRITLQAQEPVVVVCGECHSRFQMLVHDWHRRTIADSGVRSAIRDMGWSGHAARTFVRELHHGNFECRAPGCTYYAPPTSLWKRIRSFSYGNA